MRLCLAALAALFVAVAPALAATPSPLAPIELRSANDALGWMKTYRGHANPSAVAGLMKQLAAYGAFQEPEGAGLYVGFMAGVLGDNPKTAEKLAASFATALPAADQWAVIKAIAYSRLPGWRHLLEMTAPKMPTRKTMVDAYLTGKLPGFDHYRIPKDPSAAEQVWRAITFAKEDQTVYLEPSPAMLDTLWGYYFATGSKTALSDIANLLLWSKDGNDLGRLTIGSAAKYSIAANASRDMAILTGVKDVRASADKELGPILDEAIFAAETSEIAALKSEAANAIDDLRTKGPQSRRNIAWWGTAGEGAISLGCVVAAVTGQAYLGVPCVVGGAVASATLKYLATPR